MPKLLGPECELGSDGDAETAESALIAEPRPPRGANRRWLRPLAAAGLLLAVAALSALSQRGRALAAAPAPEALATELQQKVLDDVLPIDALVRDFKDSHPDFEMDTSKVKGYDYRVATVGLVKKDLAADGKPVYAGGITVTSTDSFNQWFHDVPDINKQVKIVVELKKSSSGNLVADLHDYFPIDGKGWKDEKYGHNYWFTLEMHHGFIYHGGERFTFRGDDDLWVFINRTLAIDVGGMHIPVKKSVSLDDLGLTKEAPASLDIFFAERHTRDSNFRIETTIKLDEDPCIGNFFVQLRTLSHSNLDKKSGGAQSLIYRGLSHTPGDRPGSDNVHDAELHVALKAGSSYEAADSSHNGFHGHVGRISMKRGTESTFVFTIVDPKTKKPMKKDSFFITIFDLDLGSDGSAEWVTAGGFWQKTLMSETNLKEELLTDGRTRFKAGAKGTKFDNPQDSTLLTMTQKDKSVTLEFHDFTQAELTFGSDTGGDDGDFLFEAKPSLHCAVTEGTGKGKPILGSPQTTTLKTTTKAPTTTTTTAKKEDKCCIIPNLVCFAKAWWTFWCK